jgi:hypothetical protein
VQCPERFLTELREPGSIAHGCALGGQLPILTLSKVCVLELLELPAKVLTLPLATRAHRLEL